MSIKPRQRKSPKKKILIFILLLVFLAGFNFFLYSSFIANSSSFISPLGKSNMDNGKLKQLLKNSNIEFSDILVMSDSSYVVNIPNNGQVKLSSQKDIAKQVSSLQRILRELTIEGKPFKSIDFRFNEPVILF